MSEAEGLSERLRTRQRGFRDAIDFLVLHRHYAEAVDLLEQELERRRAAWNLSEEEAQKVLDAIKASGLPAIDGDQ